MITKADLGMLKKLKHQVQAAPTMTEGEIKLAQRLTNAGLARDYSYFQGHRMRLGLRIWGITDAGKSVLEQKALADGSSVRQTLLTIKSDSET